MEAIDWLMILHPALAVVLIYPLIGVVVRLGLQTSGPPVCPDEGRKPPITVGPKPSKRLGETQVTARAMPMPIKFARVTRSPARRWFVAGVMAANRLLDCALIYELRVVPSQQSAFVLGE